jgi:hypothetical protein
VGLDYKPPDFIVNALQVRPFVVILMHLCGRFKCRLTSHFARSLFSHQFADIMLYPVSLSPCLIVYCFLFLFLSQHTNVQCTWDEGEKDRDRKLTNISQWRQLNESELMQYIASSDSEEEEEEEVEQESDKKKRYVHTDIHDIGIQPL